MAHIQSGIRLGRDYPHPVVDHDTARKRTLERYAVVRSREAASTDIPHLGDANPRKRR